MPNLTQKRIDVLMADERFRALTEDQKIEKLGQFDPDWGKLPKASKQNFLRTFAPEPTMARRAGEVTREGVKSAVRTGDIFAGSALETGVKVAAMPLDLMHEALWWAKPKVRSALGMEPEAEPPKPGEYAWGKVEEMFGKVPEPETRAERIAATTGEYVGGAGAMLMPLAAAARTPAALGEAATTAGRVGRTMIEPFRQKAGRAAATEMIAGTTGGAGAGVAREVAPGNQAAELASAVVTGVMPSAALGTVRKARSLAQRTKELKARSKKIDEKLRKQDEELAEPPAEPEAPAPVAEAPVEEAFPGSPGRRLDLEERMRLADELGEDRVGYVNRELTVHQANNMRAQARAAAGQDPLGTPPGTVLNEGGHPSNLDGVPPQREVPRPPETEVQQMLDAISNNQPLPRRVANIALSKAGGGDGIRTAIAETVQRGGGFEEARGLGQSWAETQRLADKMGWDIDNVLAHRPGQPFSAAEATAAGDYLDEVSAQILTRARMQEINPSKENLAELGELVAHHQAAAESMVGGIAEMGRGLQVLQRIREKMSQAKAIEAVIKKAGGADHLEEIASYIRQYRTPQQLARGIKAAAEEPTSYKGALLEAFKSTLLSGPRTHMTNISSNMAVNIKDLVDNAVAAAAGVARIGAKDKVYLREIPARIFGSIEGTVDGLRLARKALMDEEFSFRVGKQEQHRRYIKGVKGQLIRLPLRALGAEDVFFKSVAQTQEIRALSLRDGIQKGLRGSQLRENTRRLRANPTKEMLAKANAKADKLTFTNALGETGTFGMKMIQSEPILGFIAPFFRTPVNIAKSAIESMPTAALTKSFWKEIKKGGAARDLALAKVAVGSGIGAWAYMEAAQGRLIGAVPEDPGERAVFYANDMQPYSRKIGDDWVSFSRLEYMGSIMGLAADAWRLRDNLSEMQQNEIAGRIALSFADNLGSKTYLRGVSDFFEAYNEPERHGEKWFTRFTSAWVPGMLRQLAMSRDPNLRDAHTIVEAVMAGVPGLREQLPQRHDILGNPAQYGGFGNLIDWFNPYYVREHSPPPAAQEMLRLNVAIRPPGKKIKIGEKMVELSPEEFEYYSKWTGMAAHHFINEAMANPDWQALPAKDQRDAIETIFDKSRAQIRDVVRAKIIDEVRTGRRKVK